MACIAYTMGYLHLVGFLTKSLKVVYPQNDIGQFAVAKWQSFASASFSPNLYVLAAFSCQSTYFFTFLRSYFYTLFFYVKNVS